MENIFFDKNLNNNIFQLKSIEVEKIITTQDPYIISNQYGNYNNYEEGRFRNNTINSIQVLNRLNYPEICPFNFNPESKENLPYGYNVVNEPSPVLNPYLNIQNPFFLINGMELNNAQMNQTNYQQFNGQVNGINSNVMNGNGIYLTNPLPNDTLNTKNSQLNQQIIEQQTEIEEIKLSNKKQSKKKQPKIKQSKKNPLNEKQQKAIKKRQLKTKLQKKKSFPSVINIKEIDEKDHSNDTIKQNNQINNEKNNNKKFLILYKANSRVCGNVGFDINVFLDNINHLEVFAYSKITKDLLYYEYEPINKGKSVTVYFPTNNEQKKYICLYLYNKENEIEHELEFELRDEKWFQRQTQSDDDFNYDLTYTFNEKTYKIHYDKKHGNNENDISVVKKHSNNENDINVKSVFS